jgi:hypothetical protein
MRSVAKQGSLPKIDITLRGVKARGFFTMRKRVARLIKAWERAERVIAWNRSTRP